MNNLEQVESLRVQMEQEGMPLPERIRQLALACLDWPYVFGAWGEECTPANRKRRARDAHPTIKSKCQCLRDTNRKETCDGCQWYPDGYRVRMYDCRGFTAWLLRQFGLDLYGDGATTQYNTASNWIRRGPISEMPDCVCCVFRKVGNKMEHTGMHVGGGLVVDCSVNVRSVGMSGWTHYAIPKGLYGEEDVPVTKVRPTLRKGSRDPYVLDLQEILNVIGYNCGTADGIFGTKTYNALVLFQTDAGLNPDGVCGPKTWAALDIAEAQAPMAPADPVTYTVRAEGVTWEQYRRILEICPLAEAERER